MWPAYGVFVFVLICAPAMRSDQAATAGKHYSAGIKAAEEKEFASAARELQETLKIDPSFPGARKQLGLALFQLREYESAIPSLEQAKAEQPGDAQVLLALGTSLARTHHRERAQEVFVEL